MRIGIETGRLNAVVLAILVTVGCAGSDLPVDAEPTDILTHAEAKLADEKYFDAVEVLEHYIRTYPGTAQTPLAKLRLGDARFGLEEYVLARGEYEDVVQDFPASSFVEEARFKIARCSYASIFPHYLDQSETHQAIRLLEDFRADYPQSRFFPDAEEALAECQDRLARGDFEAGRFYEKQRRLRAAKIQYEHVLTSYPGTSWACKARLQLGYVYETRGKLEDAREWYRSVVERCPDSEEATLARKALAELGEAGNET